MTHSDSPKELCARLAVMLGGAQKSGDKLLEIEHGMALAAAYRKWALTEADLSVETRCLNNATTFVERALATMVQESGPEALPEIVSCALDQAVAMMGAFSVGTRRLLMHALNLTSRMRPALQKVWRANTLLLLAKCPDDEHRSAHPRLRLDWGQRSLDEAENDPAMAAKAHLFMGDVCAVVEDLCGARRHYEQVRRWWEGVAESAAATTATTLIGLWDVGLTISWRLSWLGSGCHDRTLMLQAADMGIWAAKSGAEIGLEAMLVSVGGPDQKKPNPDARTRFELALPEALHLTRFELLRCLATGTALPAATAARLLVAAASLGPGPFLTTQVDRSCHFVDPVAMEAGWFPQVSPREVLRDRWTNTARVSRLAMRWRGLCRTASLIEGCPAVVKEVADASTTATAQEPDDD